MTELILIAGLTLFTSFLCSILEAALYSVTPSQLEVMKGRGVFGAQRFSRFKAHVEEPIAAILTVNTIAHTVGALWCGALVAEMYDDLVLGWFTALFTLAVLFLTEIVPKSLGVRYAKRLVPILTWPLQLIVWISLPIARLCSLLMRKMSGKTEAHTPTEDEIIAMSQIAAKEGELSASEQRWMENALHLDKIAAIDIYTPRTVVQTLRADATVGEMGESLTSLAHSRFPLTEGEQMDVILGMVYRRDIFDALAADKDETKLRELVRPLDFVPPQMKGPQLLERFIRDKRHMVAVIDEYGGFEGIVTLEDVLECLLGAEIVDEHDQHADMQQFAREKAREQGVSSVETPEVREGD
ncbi:MAG: hemolysin family protein [Planctomycetota bacterium]|jgi:CBS domain containing-hemolysin-like protein